MKISITARHDMKVPELLEQMLRSKVEKLERVGHRLNSVHVIFGREKYLYTAELTLAMKGANLVGRAKHETDLMTCMEEALAKVERQLRKREDKKVGLLRRRVPHRPA